MKKYIYLLYLLAMLPSASCFARESNHVKRENILQDAIQIAAKNGYNASKVDWVHVEAAALDILKSENSDAGLNAGLFFIVSKLKDGHSFYMPPRADPQLSSAPRRITKPISEVIAGGTYPILNMHAWMGGDARSVRSATEQVRRSLIEATHGGNCGLIIDFSSNSGGNMWPMVIGLLPVLSEGVLGAFENVEGLRTTIVSTGDLLLMGGKPHFLNFPALAVPEKKPKFIALILGQHTASSGEISVLMFKGQNNVQFFGHETAGHSSANRGFPLKNGGQMFVTTSATIDRNGDKYLGSVQPDVESKNPVLVASKWLDAQCQN